MKYTPQGEDGRASVCEWELSFNFKTKEQCQNFINALMKETITYDFEFKDVSEYPKTLYLVVVTSSWAHNLVHVAKLLEEVDYNLE